MVNINRPTMMVNRCMELLNAKIASAQSRHIAKRVCDKCPRPRQVDIKGMQRERQKTERYEATKRLSMWEQNKYPPKEKIESLRMDDSHYKHLDFEERTYDCTWANFEEEPKPKKRPQLFLARNKVPVRRRKTGEVPKTARPLNAGAKDFILQWHKNKSIIQGNRS